MSAPDSFEGVKVGDVLDISEAPYFVNGIRIGTKKASRVRVLSIDHDAGRMDVEEVGEETFVITRIPAPA